MCQKLAALTVKARVSLILASLKVISIEPSSIGPDILYIDDIMPNMRVMLPPTISYGTVTEGAKFATMV